LAKIPLLGLLFSKKEIGSDEPKSAELVVFITPRIITGDTPAIKETKSPEYVLQKQPKGLKEE
jgi:type II secretory pathway component GspD/PulD (secretin)